MIRKLTAKNPFAGIGKRTQYEFYQARQKTLLAQVARKAYQQDVIDVLISRGSGGISGQLNPAQEQYLQNLNSEMKRIELDIQTCEQNVQQVYTSLTPEDQAEVLLTKLSSY